VSRSFKSTAGALASFVLVAILASLVGCVAESEINPNPWLVPFTERHGSTISRSQMRAMKNLANIYRDHEMMFERRHALITAVELYAGDQAVTFELLNIFIDEINNGRIGVMEQEAALDSFGIDVAEVSNENLPDGEVARQIAVSYIEARERLNQSYEECYRMLSTACGQIPYNVELYYATANLQYIRAEEDGDRAKYRDAIHWLKNAIATSSEHLESYHLIAMSYERLGDPVRAIRFWRLFEVIYEIAPEVRGEGFITESRMQMHEDALFHISVLGILEEIHTSEGEDGITYAETREAASDRIDGLDWSESQLNLLNQILYYIERAEGG